MGKKSSLSKYSFSSAILAAQGKLPCDLIIDDVTYLDVFSCEWRKGSIGIKDGVIVGVDSGLKAKRTISGRGKFLVPGFVDAHVHVESSLMTPLNFEQVVLKKGTTTAICDPHEIANVLGTKGIQYFLKASEKANLNLQVMLSSCVPATTMETNGAGNIEAAELLELASHPNALGLAEVMNFPGVVNQDPKVVAKLKAFLGRPIDGHAPLVRGQALSAYAAAGINSCHESSQLDEAQEKLSKGVSVWIREGSVAKDLDTLVPLLNLATSTSIGFCTDDRNPLDIRHEGHIDYLIRSAIRRGVTPTVAYRAASWSVARHYGLDKLSPSRGRLGAVAPGYIADLVLLSDAETCAVDRVFKSGIAVEDLDFVSEKALRFANTIRAKLPNESELIGPAGRVHVIGVLSGKIVTDHHVLNHDAPGIARLSVLERYGGNSKPANGYVSGFGPRFHGAIASSVGHDSHNLITVGTSTKDMRTALSALMKSGGGFCVVKDGNVLSQLPLSFGGLMTAESANGIEKKLTELREASKTIGCDLAEPFLQLAFLSLPVIPSLKLTDKGLVDVTQFKIIGVRAA